MQVRISRNQIKRLSRIVAQGLALTVLAYTILALTATLVYRVRHKHDPYVLGVSFSIKYARELELDWRETYTALLDDAKVRNFRLMSYWDLGEPQEGVYNFDDLDWQLSEAAQRGAKVSLAIGLRQPRYPECHQPDWVNRLSPGDRDRVLKRYIQATVEHVKNSPALASYQLENEALNTAFGQCHDFNRDRLNSEYALVKELDRNHPVIVSVSNEFGLPVIGPIPDIVGFSVYRRVYQPLAKVYFQYPLPPVWHGSRAAIIELFERRPTIIHELQTEPWGPVSTVDLPLAEQNKSMDASRVESAVNYAKASGIHEMYLWGGEWWYWRLTKFNDDSLWSAAKKIYSVR